MKLINGGTASVENGEICIDVNVNDGEYIQYMYITETELDELYHLLQKEKNKERD